MANNKLIHVSTNLLITDRCLPLDVRLIRPTLLILYILIRCHPSREFRLLLFIYVSKAIVRSLIRPTEKAISYFVRMIIWLQRNLNALKLNSLLIVIVPTSLS